jgi:predicted transcriptional regulator
VLKPFATKLDDKIIDMLDALSKKTQIPKSRLCRQAIELLAAHYDRLEKNLAMVERLQNQDEVLVAAETEKV